MNSRIFRQLDQSLQQLVDNVESHLLDGYKQNLIHWFTILSS